MQYMVIFYYENRIKAMINHRQLHKDFPLKCVNIWIFAKDMVYFYTMEKRSILRITAMVFCLLWMAGSTPAFCQEHIKKLDTIRTSMTELGNGMAERIKNAQPRDIRTLERVFEINNYALATIESYFKMIKIAISSHGTINEDIIAILNGWLEFIGKYCKADIQYFDEVLSETKDPAIISLVETEKKNIQDLMNAATTAVDENKSLLRESAKR